VPLFDRRPEGSSPYSAAKESRSSGGGGEDAVCKPYTLTQIEEGYRYWLNMINSVAATHEDDAALTCITIVNRFSDYLGDGRGIAYSEADLARTIRGVQQSFEQPRGGRLLFAPAGGSDESEFSWLSVDVIMKREVLEKVVSTLLLCAEQVEAGVHADSAIVAAVKKAKPAWPKFCIESEFLARTKEVVLAQCPDVLRLLEPSDLRDKVLLSLALITRDTLCASRDVLLLPAKAAGVESLIIVDANWLTNGILGALFDPSSEWASVRAPAQADAEEAVSALVRNPVSYYRLITMDLIRAAAKRDMNRMGFDVDVPDLTDALLSVGACVPVTVSDDTVIAVGEATDRSTVVYHWFPAKCTDIMSEEEEEKYMPDCDHVVARQFRSAFFPPGYFPHLFVCVVSLFKESPRVRIWKNGMVLQSRCNGIEREVVIRFNESTMAFNVTVAIKVDACDLDEDCCTLCITTLDSILDIVYSRTEWIGPVRSTEYGLDPISRHGSRRVYELPMTEMKKRLQGMTKQAIAASDAGPCFFGVARRERAQIEVAVRKVDETFDQLKDLRTELSDQGEMLFAQSVEVANLVSAVNIRNGVEVRML
jgi:hypothetical protein